MAPPLIDSVNSRNRSANTWSAVGPAVIECDSRRWHDNPLTRQNDADKQAILQAHGYRVLRITWQQVVDHPAQTLARIRAALGDPR